MSNDNYKEIEKLAREVLILSRNTLLVNLRFPDMVLSRLKFLSSEYPGMLTNGEYFIFNPVYVLNCFKEQRELVARNYLTV